MEYDPDTASDDACAKIWLDAPQAYEQPHGSPLPVEVIDNVDRAAHKIDEYLFAAARFGQGANFRFCQGNIDLRGASAPFLGDQARPAERLSAIEPRCGPKRVPRAAR